MLARVGAIVEEPHFHRHLTGRENLRVIAAVRGPEVRGRIDGALRRVGLADRADDRVRTYSQGMRQRLGVARCLLADPELLILDEPMNGLDPGGILEFRTMIGELTGEGRTVFLSSHLLDEVEKTCHAAAVIDRGRIIAQGPISELVQDDHNELDIGCDDHHAALDLLDGHPAVAAAYPTPDGIRVTLAGDRRRRLGQRPPGHRRGPRLAPGAGARVAGAALPGNDVSSRRSGMTLTVTRQMIGAEVLKVRRNRSVMALALLLTVGVVVLMYGYVAIRHSSNPFQNEPAGGILGMHRGVRDLGEFFGMLAAVLIGAEVGTADLSSGVFRDLVTTGRSRLALFGVRAPAAAIVTLCMTGAAYAAGAAGDVSARRRHADAQSRPRPAGRRLDRAGQRRRLVAGGRRGLADRVARPHADRGHRVAGDPDQHPGQRVVAGLRA